MNLMVKDYKLVGLQLLLFILYIFDFQIIEFRLPSIIKVGALVIAILGALVLILAMLQLNRNLSPFPSPKSNSELVQNGLYKYIRHPIYTGILLSFLGFAIFSESFYRILITLILYGLFIMKSKYEEVLLMQRYDEYISYKKSTGRFFPKF